MILVSGMLLGILLKPRKVVYIDKHPEEPGAEPQAPVEPTECTIPEADNLGRLSTVVNQIAGMFSESNGSASAGPLDLRKAVGQLVEPDQAGPAVKLGGRLLMELGAMLKCRGGSFYQVEVDSLELASALNSDHAPDRIPLPLQAGTVFETVLSSGQPFYTEDISRKAGFVSSGWSGYRDGSVMVFPLKDSSQRTIGLLSLYNKEDGALTVGDFNLASVLVTVGNKCIANLDACQALDESDKQYRRLVNLAQDGIVVLNETDTFTFVNPAFSRSVGYTADELSRMSIFDLADKDTARFLAKGTQDRKRGITSTYEVVLYTKEGNPRTFLITANPLFGPAGEYEGSLGVLTDITKRKEAECSMHESIEKYRGYISNAPDAVAVFDTNGRFLEVNDAGLRMMGYTREEASEMTIFDCFFEENMPRAKERFKVLHETGSYSSENLFRRKDGSSIRVLFTANRVSPGRFIGFAKDITDLRLTQERLAEKHAFLGSIFSVLSEQVCVVNPGLEVIDANLAYREARMDLYGNQGLSHCFDNFCCNTENPGQPNANCPAEKSFADGKSHTVNHHFTRPDGSVTHMEVTSSPVVGPDGEVTSVVLVMRDVTSKLMLEQRARETHKVEALGRLAGGVAHDFNNILVAISGYTELVLEELPADSRVRADLNEINRASKRARDLVRQILNFSYQSKDAGRPVRIGPVVAEVLRLLRATVPTTIEMTEQVETAFDTVYGDPSQLHQVLLNLCTNACQAMAGSGGRLVVRVAQVEITRANQSQHGGLPHGQYIEISVADEGHGIEPDLIERIFEPFFTTKKVGEGTGLGLAVTQGIVVSYGGSIVVASNPGVGTVMKVYLPRYEGVEHGEPEVVQPDPTGRERVLFVDDEQMLISVASKMLAKLGYQVTAFKDATEALEVFSNDPMAYDIVVTDQTMPGMTGGEFARNLLAIRPELPIVLCTGFSEVMSAENAMKVGVTKYFMKPYTGRELAEVIREALDKTTPR